MKITDENVVQQIILKNEQTIPYLIQNYGGLLNSIIRKYLKGNQQDTEECLADVITSIWFHIDSFDSRKNEFKQWIAAIAKYRAIDYIRKTEKTKRQVSKFEFDEHVYHQSTLKPSGIDLSAILSELSDTERAIFEKYYVEGVPSNEIAEEYNVKQSWVHNKLSRGRKKLKTLLLKDGV
ncbi:sigma-70 family RNA polymerase sigma factor [Psychrobacillus sp. NEAU-3TGS]|uniref:sigma-70 family RNA polymerase sigma factor n=1 Tax=Psychrobacillus sp. NEAU-3TGS TaxID=2995412 RepID=UPI002496AB45|nr:sigma-70 family RNA polymerase sigma factor [Psychrobacillus sp. NEAU-3TGS]MDI2588711.1 sigma-70 family RNA polymerase sigma factor [Psychrobacillus sp. NEAU-3TGS]